MKIVFFFIIALLNITNNAFAQKNETIRFLDALNEKPLNNVNIVNNASILISQTDSLGYVIFPASSFNYPNYLIAFCPGYKPDTLTSFSPTVYLHSLSVLLPTAEISSIKTHKLLRASTEYVLDYNFIDSNIIVLSYSGDNGRHAKLFLLNKNGDVLIVQNIASSAISIFKSCVDNFYCVYDNMFYQIKIDSNKIYLQNPHNITLLNQIQHCELSIDSNLYYRIGDMRNFTMSYCMIQKRDSILREIYRFSEKKVANASNEELAEIIDLLFHNQFHEAAIKQNLRQAWDKGSYAQIDIPFFNIGDTLIIFDYYKKCILYFNSAGTYLGFTAIHFDWNSSQFNKIIEDEVMDKFYIYSTANEYTESLQEINIQTGEVASHSISIEKPFATNIKIYNNDIYYLWQDTYNSATRQLFIQKMD